MIENQENEKRYATLDGQKDLTLEQISKDFKNFLRGRKELDKCSSDHQMLEMMARLFLIRRNYVPAGKKPMSSTSQEIFDNLVKEVKKMQLPASETSLENNVSVFSKREQGAMLAGARKLKKTEEDRAGQTYEESGLE
jgi:hypothetical protein